MNGTLFDSQPIKESIPQWVQLIYKVGVPSVIALYLVYLLGSGSMTLLADIDRGQRQHIADSEVQKDLLKDILDSSLRSEAYQRLQCLSLAKTAVDKQVCLTVK